MRVSRSRAASLPIPTTNPSGLASSRSRFSTSKQHADASATLKFEQSHDQPAELVGGRPKQLVLRERLEQGDGRLVVVRAGDQVLGRDDLLELVVKERGPASRLHVGLRREQ